MGVKQILRKLAAPRCSVIMLSISISGVALSTLPALGQSAEEFDPYPLQSADTSSPRETLRTFLTNTNVVIKAWRDNAIGPAAIRARDRAVATLDFGAIPDVGAYQEENERILLLKEILDRVEVPPFDAIPGDGEVADGSVTQWSIPNTSIGIELIESGRQSGQFLFSAETVAQLDQFYARARHLPYKPGASIGAYEDYLIADGTFRDATEELRNRLKPVDTSSPRSTLQGFLDAVNRAQELVLKANAALEASPPTMTKQRARALEARATNLLRRARGTLDLSQVPAALRQEAAFEAVLQIKEVLDRAPLPPLRAVPNARIAEFINAESSGPSSRNGGLRWRIPNTDIEIVEITDGERAGEFLFSARTVRRVGEILERLQDLPYRSERFTQLAAADGYRSPGTSDGFYTSYISTPGGLVPRASVFGAFIEDLPDQFHTLLGDQTVWQWIGLALTMLAVALAIHVSLVIARLVRRLRHPWDDWVRILAPVFAAGVVVAVRDFVDNDLNITGEVLTVVSIGTEAIVLLSVAWAVFMFFLALVETIIASPRIPAESVNATLLRIAARVAGFLVGAWIFIAGIKGLGADVVPLLAGLGVGGLAVALAAQTTIANFIGSLIVLANKPVRVGDFCRYGDKIGMVEQIGLISTRIRSLERTIVTVPNAEFSQMHIDNFGMWDKRLLRTTLQLRYETTPEQMRYVLANLRELLLGHPKVAPEPARVRFVSFGGYSKDVELFAYLRCQGQGEFLAIQEDILLRAEEVITAAGTGFAFPSQTAYLARDAGVDAERKDQAESQVEQWRAKGKLPFPEFEEEERERLEDTLEYPPRGSPDYVPRVDFSNMSKGRPADPQSSNPPTLRSWSKGFLKKRAH